MRRRKKLILVTTVIVVAIVGSAMGIGCSRTEDEERLRPESRDELPNEAPLTKVAEILQIDQQKLEDAFAQARSEVRHEALDDNQPESLLARVAEILGIGQKDLEDAFAQTRSEMPNGVPWQGPANSNHGSWHVWDDNEE
jgi:hypothetical protein